MEVFAVDEYNDKGHLIYAANYPGAFVRGRTRAEALAKFPAEMAQYVKWADSRIPLSSCNVTVIQEKLSTLRVQDADSDVLFDSEVAPLTREEYDALRQLSLRSARDFQRMYHSIPDKTHSVRQPRRTFYGDVPITAETMYLHTRNVNAYYFGEIGVNTDNSPDIVFCREKGFDALEHIADFLSNPVIIGSYEEAWSIRKVCRRFIWHDRIHARAMYRMAAVLCGKENIENPFHFN